MNFHLEFRAVPMAIAIFIVIMHHTGIDQVNLAYIGQRGFLGVDTFVFLSGAGCYYSLCSCSNPYAFLKKRLLRLGPSYWIFNVIFMTVFWKHLVYPFDYIADFYFVMRMFKLSRPNWYFSGVWIFYLAILLFFPLVKCIQRFQVLVGYVIILILFGYATSDNLMDQLIFGRLPVLFCGLYFGKCSKEMQSLSPRVYLPIFLMLAFGINLIDIPLQDTSYTYFPMRWMVTSVCVTPGFCLVALNASYFLSLTSPTRVGVKILMKIGEISFECLLLHVGILIYQFTYPEVFPYGYVTLFGFSFHQFYFNVGGTLIGSFLLHFFSYRLSTFMSPFFDRGIKALTTEQPSNQSMALPSVEQRL